MSIPAQPLTPDFLIAELQARGLHYLIGPLPVHSIPQLSVGELLAALAEQQDARLRSALIPLFLQQPHLAEALPLALQRLSPQDQLVLKVYYTAAVILQELYEQVLKKHIARWCPLPDPHSEELGVPREGSVSKQLYQLGAFHTQLTGRRVNWPGTYHHAAERLIQRTYGDT